MKRAKISKLSFVLWIIITGCWLIVLGADLFGESSPLVTIVHALIALLSLTSAIFQFILYKKQNEAGKESEKP